MQDLARSSFLIGCVSIAIFLLAAAVWRARVGRLISSSFGFIETSSSFALVIRRVWCARICRLISTRSVSKSIKTAFSALLVRFA
jgi:hypothetical protein